MEKYELINQINDFYNSAWEKLLIFGSVAFTIIGIIVPLLIQWYQKKTLSIRETEIKAHFEKEIQIIKEELKKDMKLLLTEEIKVFEDKAMKIKNNSEGGLYHIQANNAFENNDHYEALRSYVASSMWYLEGDNYYQLRCVLEAIEECLDHVKKIDMHNIKQHDSLDFDLVLTKTLQKEITGTFKDLISDIRRKITELK